MENEQLVKELMIWLWVLVAAIYLFIGAIIFSGVTNLMNWIQARKIYNENKNHIGLDDKLS